MTHSEELQGEPEHEQPKAGDGGVIGICFSGRHAETPRPRLGRRRLSG